MNDKSREFETAHRYKVETALRFLESISNSRILSHFAMENVQGGVLSAMAIVANEIGEVAPADFAKRKIPELETDSDLIRDRRERRSRSPEQDVF